MRHPHLSIAAIAGAAMPARPAPPRREAAAAFVASRDPAARERALECLTQAIYYEARSQIRRRAARGRAGGAEPRPPPVLSEQRLRRRLPGLGARTGCQFSFTCDGSMSGAIEPGAWDRARRIAAAALGGQRLSPGRPRHSIITPPRSALLGAEPGPAGGRSAPTSSIAARQHGRAFSQAPAEGRTGCLSAADALRARARSERALRRSNGSPSSRFRSRKSRSSSARCASAPSAPGARVRLRHVSRPASPRRAAMRSGPRVACRRRRAGSRAAPNSAAPAAGS